MCMQNRVCTTSAKDQSQVCNSQDLLGLDVVKKIIMEDQVHSSLVSLADVAFLEPGEGRVL